MPPRDDVLMGMATAIRGAAWEKVLTNGAWGKGDSILAVKQRSKSPLCSRGPSRENDEHMPKVFDHVLTRYLGRCEHSCSGWNK